MVRRFDRSAISLERQARGVVKQWPDFEYRIERGVLEITGRMQPTPLTQDYSFAIQYTLGKVPTVRIIEPELVLERDGHRLEHVYEEGRPCVFRPSVDWTGRTFLATTVVPWLAEWLFYYEIWLATGEWSGGGAHPTSSPEQDVPHGRDESRPSPNSRRRCHAGRGGSHSR